ncbi:MAG: hypothetical protein JSV82_05055 [Planctomycetota bacterium]|nr:MAG: hypothetical protein JSV82_05055 [Planctomycetota bacterium]
MKTKKFLVYLLAGILGGCIPVISLHPLFTEEALVFEEKLLGTWVDDTNCPKSTWEFKRAVDSSEEDWDLPPEIREKAYILIFTNDKGKKGSFIAGLSTCFERLFLNVCPSQFPCTQPDPNEDRDLNSFLFIAGHSFIIIDSIEPKLKMRWITNDAMRELLEKDPGAVKHQLVEDRVILTASTQELQAFVLKYVNDNKVFSAEVVLARKKPKECPEPNSIDPNQTKPNAMEPKTG